jgi:hypothetical protein
MMQVRLTNTSMRYLGEGSEGSFWLYREQRVLADPHIHLGSGTASK